MASTFYWSSPTILVVYDVQAFFSRYVPPRYVIVVEHSDYVAALRLYALKEMDIAGIDCEVQEWMIT